MFPVSEANFFSEKKTGFLIHSGHKTAATIVPDFGRGGFGCDRGVRINIYGANGVGCGYQRIRGS